jgi:hypothetical protein
VCLTHRCTKCFGGTLKTGGCSNCPPGVSFSRPAGIRIKRTSSSKSWQFPASLPGRNRLSRPSRMDRNDCRSGRMRCQSRYLFPTAAKGRNLFGHPLVVGIGQQHLSMQRRFSLDDDDRNICNLLREAPSNGRAGGCREYEDRHRFTDDLCRIAIWQ